MISIYQFQMVENEMEPFELVDPIKVSSDSKLPDTRGDDFNIHDLKIDFYGGSLTVGRDFKDYKARRFSTIVGQKLGITVANKGIPAAGPSPHFVCGIEPADIIISEFRINEKNAKVLDRWYKLAHENARHVIIFDLWSWLSPPPPRSTEAAATVKALMQQNPPFPDVKISFSVLSLAEQDRYTWKSHVPTFFNYTIPNSLTGATIPEECYQAFESVKATRAQEATLKQCRQKYARAMQHGQEPYHQYVAGRLIEHMKEKVFPMLNLTNPSRGGGGKPKQEKATSLCIGEWGISQRKWDRSVILNNTGFDISSPFSNRDDKTTLNTNSTSASLVLGCPPGYPFIQLGYVAHSFKNETAVMTVNKKTAISTQLEITPSFALRLLRYSGEKNSAPIHVSVSSINPGAFLEIASAVCSRK